MTDSRAPRQGRSTRNDALIVQATADLLADHGWPAITFVGVAHRAGLSERPVRDRYSTHLQLATAAWEEVIAPVLADSLASVLSVVSSGDAHDLASAFDPFLRPDRRHRAAAEMLSLAAHNEGARAAVTATLTHVKEALDPSRTGGPRQAATQGYAVMLALGLLMEFWRKGTHELDLTSSLVALASVLENPAEPVDLPPQRATHLDEAPVIDTGDPLWDAVLIATLRLVGTRGYEAATVEAIVAEAGCSQSVLFRHYATKADAFFDATRRMIGRATQLNVDYQALLVGQYSRGIAEAVMMREFMRPGREIPRIIELEQYRLAWHHETMRVYVETEQAPVHAAYLETLTDVSGVEAQARLHLELALGMGTVLLAQLIPDAWQLPYDVVTVPLLDRAV